MEGTIMTGVNSVARSEQYPKYSVLQMIIIFLFPFFGLEELNGSAREAY